ncbi:MarR family winged helix-turn-helix transcriptional regulator [Streptomyces sp. NPDC088789]|uniref:MarR family winged helix-turn-helix transcriptional regulator n=1 Tax=Streptomyces sp. NPDC088789 TaxID=3365899 RepID=UPI0037F6689A
MAEVPVADEQGTAGRPGEAAGGAAEQGERIMRGLRAWGATYTEFTRRFAAHLGLHSTDAVALLEILYAEDQGAPLSLARLGERISLTSGATTALVDRLEKAGHIVRVRGEQADRRVVTLRGGPAIGEPAVAFFTPFDERMQRLMASYPPELIERFEGFLQEMHTDLAALLAEEYSGGKPRGRHP